MNLDDFERDNRSTYAVITTVVTTAWLGREERQLQVVARMKSLKEPCYVQPVLEWEMKMGVMVMNDDAVPLRDFLLCGGMNAFRLWMRDEMMKGVL